MAGNTNKAQNRDYYFINIFDYPGNTTMTAMGVLGVVDKVNMTDEKEERLRAAVMKGAPPPPPMGYAGGATLPGRNTVLTRKRWKNYRLFLY